MITAFNIMDLFPSSFLLFCLQHLRPLYLWIAHHIIASYGQVMRYSSWGICFARLLYAVFWIVFWGINRCSKWNDLNRNQMFNHWCKIFNKIVLNVLDGYLKCFMTAWNGQFVLYSQHHGQSPTEKWKWIRWDWRNDLPFGICDP